MKYMLSELIVQMQHELTTQTGGYVHRVESLLEKVVVLNDSACIGPLLSLLNDDTQYDEVMFSIIHTIEQFDDVTYAQGIMCVLESLVLAAPRWGAIIHMRVFNSPRSLDAYVRCAKHLSPHKKQLVQRIVENVRNRNSTFHESCDRVLAVLSEV